MARARKHRSPEQKARARIRRATEQKATALDLSFLAIGKCPDELSQLATLDVQAYYVEPIGVGDILPEMPLFLTDGWQVPVPLESTYQATWNTSPEDFRVAIETGVMPELDVE